MIQRRIFLCALGACALGASLPAPAQQPRVPRVGMLAFGPAPTDRDAAFVDSMRELGYIEGKNVAYEWRFARFQVDRLNALAKELVRSAVSVIVTIERGIAPAHEATATIPIVMLVSADPVRSGYAASLARPGGNITGMTSLAEAIAPKQIELLKLLLPKLTRVGVLLSPTNVNANNLVLESLHTAARKLNVQVFTNYAATAAAIEQAFSEMSRHRVEALIVPRATLFSDSYQGRQVAELAAKARLPAIYTGWEFAGGGLMSYAPSITESYRRAATYVDKILRGAKPGDLPIEQPTSFELVINRKIAKDLGLAIPNELLLRADRVIE